MRQYFPIEDRVCAVSLLLRVRNDRPLLGFFVGSEYPMHRYEACRSLPGYRPLTPDDFPVEPYLDDCDHLFEVHESCGGDFIWSGSEFWGIPWLEAALGCPIRADHSTGSIYSSRRLISVAGTICRPLPRTPSGWSKCVEFIDKLAARSRGHWPIGTTRMRGISDLLSALYGGTDFVLAMMERPDEVRLVCERLTEFWIEFGRLQLEHIPLFEGGVGSFYYNMWAPPGTVWHQEDAAALLSPRLYDTFIRECDERIVNAFDGCIMHQHPTKFVPTDFYLQMPFKALELHVDRGGPSAGTCTRGICGFFSACRC